MNGFSRYRDIMKKGHVKLLDEYNVSVICNECGTIWSPNLQSGGKLPRGWWKCPYGCTDRVLKEAEAVIAP